MAHGSWLMAHGSWPTPQFARSKVEDTFIRTDLSSELIESCYVICLRSDGIELSLSLVVTRDHLLSLQKTKATSQCDVF